MTTEQRSGYPSGLVASCWEVLMHFYWSPVVPDFYREKPYPGAIESLEAEKLIRFDGPTGFWTLTDRGMVIGKHIANLSLPVPSWELR